MTPSRPPRKRNVETRAGGPSAPAADTFKYDVAISLLKDDLPLAIRLEKALRPLSVFLYKNRVEDVAGRNGPETFTQVFESQSRLAVILHRAGWGSTTYTHIEERAIQARAARFRYGTFLAIKLDDSLLPPWIPTLVEQYLDFDQFGFNEAVGVIRQRAREHGAVLRSESATEEAIRMATEANAQRDRDRQMRTPDATRLLGEECRRLFQLLKDQIELVAREGNVASVVCGFEVDRFVVRREGVSAALHWHQRYANSLDGAMLEAVDIQGPANIPGEVGMRFTTRSERGAATEFVPVLTEEGLRWREKTWGRREKEFGSTELADWFVARYFHRVLKPEADWPIIRR
jgi:hypothetical protein